MLEKNKFYYDIKSCMEIVVYFYHLIKILRIIGIMHKE